ncbi:hypothetical protein M409DRAFT_71216 [Zasmidium cellare ATCC 36951]|uniref:Uncharacterized protein n=1 Tax=Zasmidium cellare ATCC 36951 TaxID=1080233 RepID=A0A6A6C088_ZASCE|nr:uncharacterized protein M409DRAFT_71216 [Zasmidium cellare ATCC 36951]KAF2159229.1 hypothetical protein M409DRAFT_71216 [Zasmidium cellare ATCC 36951]
MHLRARSKTAATIERELGEVEMPQSPHYEEEAALQRQGLLHEQQTYFREEEKMSSSSTGLRAVFYNQGKTFFLLLASWLLFYLYIRLPRTADSPPSVVEDIPSQEVDEVSEAILDPANLHLLIPASAPDPNFCKAVLSAGILGYPAPVIIDVDEGSDAGLYTKLSGVKNYLKKLDTSHDEDLVLLVDGYDIFMQSRPQTLIDRYFGINVNADERIATQLKGAAEDNDIRQEIIFGAQKRCWPWSETDPACYAMPPSSLPKDIYGPNTDTDIGNELNPYIKFRPRYLNSGVVLGSVRAMKKLFSQALEILQYEANMLSDQHIFSHILGDQELWREAIRRDSLSGHEKLLDTIKDFVPNTKFNTTHLDLVRIKAAMRKEKSYEFHIGLDYASELGLSTVFAEDETAWLTWSNTNQLLQADQTLNITPSASQLQNLSTDISTTLPPFWTFNVEKSLQRWKPWTDIPLFTNIPTGVVPAIIHHNAHREGREALRHTWWPETWFYTSARILYDAWVYEPLAPIAFSGGRDWWPAEKWKGGAKNWTRKADGMKWEEQWVRFESVCGEFHEEVFGDGRGVWKLPEDH